MKIDEMKLLSPFQQAVIALLERILSRINDIAKEGED